MSDEIHDAITDAKEQLRKMKQIQEWRSKAPAPEADISGHNTEKNEDLAAYKPEADSTSETPRFKPLWFGGQMVKDRSGWYVLEDDYQKLERELAQAQKRLIDAEESRDFYKRRVELLEREKFRMRHPEMMLVCDILANAALSPDSSRYQPNAGGDT